MGCEYYHYNPDGNRSDSPSDVCAKFSEMWEAGCLCTTFLFDPEGLDAQQVEALAYLGAWYLLAMRGMADPFTALPDGLPDRVRHCIQAVCAR